MLESDPAEDEGSRVHDAHARLRNARIGRRDSGEESRCSDGRQHETMHLASQYAGRPQE